MLLLLLMVISTVFTEGEPVDPPLVHRTDCSTLRLGQYICPDPEYDLIDPATQQPRGCTKENKAKVAIPRLAVVWWLLTKSVSFQNQIPNLVCKAADGIICHGSGNSTFKREIPCKFTNGYSFETALLLSIFLGMFGADRFYLGYPAMGLLKFCTLGFMFLGQLVDVILIATQVVGPADGSFYCTLTRLEAFYIIFDQLQNTQQPERGGLSVSCVMGQ